VQELAFGGTEMWHYPDMCTAYKIGKTSKGGIAPGVPWYEIEIGSYLRDISSKIIRPTHKAPVIKSDGNLREMSWGFRRQMKGKSGRPITRTIVNSREDKLSGYVWSDAFRERRCLIPAISFFEWVELDGQMAPLEFVSGEGSLLWIAGIWEADEERGEVFSMISTEPNAQVAPVHDRMPAVLLPGQVEPFLGGEIDEFGPSGVPLNYTRAANFLTRAKDSPLLIQDELF
jgi:putative SOS response-associated peptidase YedK